MKIKHNKYLLFALGFLWIPITLGLGIGIEILFSHYPKIFYYILLILFFGIFCLMGYGAVKCYYEKEEKENDA